MRRRSLLRWPLPLFRGGGRATLTPDGEPWVYDSIPNCGCYHQFFPTARAAPKTGPDTLDETAFVPQALPTVAPGERYWFWPMGVPEPGAMRQWGRHATAFVGRRHFDDSDFLEKYFEMKP